MFGQAINGQHCSLSSPQEEAVKHGAPQVNGEADLNHSRSRPRRSSQDDPYHVSFAITQRCLLVGGRFLNTQEINAAFTSRKTTDKSSGLPLNSPFPHVPRFKNTVFFLSSFPLAAASLQLLLRNSQLSCASSPQVPGHRSGHSAGHRVFLLTPVEYFHKLYNSTRYATGYGNLI